MKHIFHIDNKIAVNSGFSDRTDLVGKRTDGCRRQNREDNGSHKQGNCNDKRHIIMAKSLYKTTQLVFFFSRSICINICTHNPNSSLLSCDNAIS